MKSLISHFRKMLCENQSTMFDDIPLMEPPSFDSQEMLEDVNAVLFYLKSPANSHQFNMTCHDDMKIPFHNYFDKHDLDVDRKELNREWKRVGDFAGSLKKKYGRFRPKEVLPGVIPDTLVETIPDMDSLSYPSAHAAYGYFVARRVGERYPEHEPELVNIADRLAQSRVDLGVHFPSDCMLGKLIGEESAARMSVAPYEKLNERDRARECKRNLNRLRDERDNRIRLVRESDCRAPSYSESLAHFLVRSNEIERYVVPYTPSLTSARYFISGLPPDKCSDNEYISSHLRALQEASLRSLESLTDICAIHRALGDNVLERGKAGMLRHFDRKSGSGIWFVPPTRIQDAMNWWMEQDWDDPWIEHAAFERIHPFPDGNGRTGRILLCKRLGFDFNRANDMIGNDYIDNIVDFANNNMMSKIIGKME